MMIHDRQTSYIAQESDRSLCSFDRGMLDLL